MKSTSICRWSVLSSALTTTPGPASPPMASIETVRARATQHLLGGKGFSSWLSRLRDRHNDRRNRRYDAGAWARRNSGSRHERRLSGRGATGACCGATARFFVLGPPWRETPGEPHLFRGVRQARAVGSRKAKSFSRQKAAFPSQKLGGKRAYSPAKMSVAALFQALEDRK